MKLSEPCRRLLLASLATLAAAAILAFWLPAPASLAVAPGRDMPFFSLPFGPNPFAPGELKTADGALVDWRGIPSARDCGECHRQEFLEWASSIHAVSDEDAIYDSSVRENTSASQAGAVHGDEKGRWCESCHNPLGTLTGIVTPTPSVPLTETLEEGTSCIVCHTAVHAEPLAGNGALTVNINGIFRHLHPALIMAAPARHARDMQARRSNPLLGSSALCGACHTEIRPTAVSGEEPMNFQDTYDEWRRSPWAAAGVQCQDCHMARDPAAYVAALKRGEKPARTVSHRLAGNNYLLSDPDLPPDLLQALRGGPPPGLNRLQTRQEALGELRATHREVTGLLREAAELTVEARPGQAGELAFAVAVNNAGAGHALPTGPLDQRYMWLEVEVVDGRGRGIYHRGAFDGKKGIEDPRAPHWLKVITDAAGREDRRHILFDADRLRYTRKPIPAGGSDRVDYAVPLPAGSAGPYRVKARLWYRLAFQDILQNIERQGLGKVEAIIPPLLLKETVADLAAGRPPAAAPGAAPRPAASAIFSATPGTALDTAPRTAP